MVWEVEYTDELEQMTKSFKNLIDKMSKEGREKLKNGLKKFYWEWLYKTTQNAKTNSKATGRWA